LRSDPQVNPDHCQWREVSFGYENAPNLPACNSPEVKEIAYGFPGSEFDFDKYEVGGCCVTDNDPDFKCMKCETTW